MAVDQEKVREHIRGILEAIGEDPDREGLRETPDRIARMYSEIFEGIQYTNDEIANMFNKTFYCYRYSFSVKICYFICIRRIE